MADQGAPKGNEGLFSGPPAGENRGGEFGVPPGDFGPGPSAAEIRGFDNSVSALVARKGDLMRRIRHETGILGALSKDHSENMRGIQREFEDRVGKLNEEYSRRMQRLGGDYDHEVEGEQERYKERWEMSYNRLKGLEREFTDLENEEDELSL